MTFEAPDSSVPGVEPGSILDGRVPAYMLPRYVQFVPSIPRTETQKIQRKALQENGDGVIDLVGRS